MQKTIPMLKCPLVIILAAIILTTCNNGPNDSEFKNPCDPESDFFISPVETFPFYIYKDFSSPENHFLKTTLGDTNLVLIEEDNPDSPQSGLTAMKVTYPNPNKSDFDPTTQDSASHTYWLPTYGSFGTEDDGINLSLANKFSLWARGSEGGEVVKFGIGGGTIRGENTPFPDSIDPLQLVPLDTYVVLDTTWRQFSIDMNEIVGIDSNKYTHRLNNLCRVRGAFSFKVEWPLNQKSTIFYIDEVKYEQTPY